MKNRNPFLNHRKQIFGACITAIVTLSLFGGISVFSITQPKVSTCYYHFNIQYKAGDESTYDNIILSMAQIIWMYGNHSTWRYTIETQFMTIEYMHEHFPNVFEEMRRQNRDGQLELIVPQYSNAWHPPYPLKTFVDSINYTQVRMDEWGLIPSRLILLQEGQWLPGFTEIGDVGGFDAIIAHREQFSYMNYYPDEPVLEWTYNGKTKHVIVNPRLPRTEAGVFHFQIYAADGELINTGDLVVDVGPADKFEFNPEKQKNHEDHLLQLERLGAQFLRMDEFYRFCVERKQVGKLDKFIPEIQWVPNQYDQFFTWMGNGGGNTDDGAFLARSYWTMNYVRSVELLLNHAYSSNVVDDSQYLLWGMNRINYIDGILLNASKKVWEAQVSDTTGINPIMEEFWYGMNRTQEAYELAKYVLEEIRGLPSVSSVDYSEKFQINLFTGQIEFDTNDFNSDIFVQQMNLSDIEDIFEIEIEVSQKESFSSIPELNYTFSAEQRNYTTPNWETEYYKLRWDFYGKFNISWPHGEADFVYLEKNREPSIFDYLIEEVGENDSGNNIDITFKDNWMDVSYSPALSENSTQNLTRTDYYSTIEGSSYEWLCLLSMPNGFIYNIEAGYGIVKNNTVSHLAADWKEESVAFREEKVKYNSSREYYLVEGTLDEILRFSNQINTFSTMTLEEI